MPKGVRVAVRYIAVFSLCLLSYTAALAATTSVIVSEARPHRFEDRVEALGTLKAKESAVISTPVTETVGALHFDDGDRVKAGQVLVEMTTAEERALLEEIRVRVDEARRQHERVKSLQAQGQAAVSLVDERQREWRAAEAQLQAIEARIADRTIKAPFSGVLGLRNVSVGALVEVGDVITTIDDDSAMKLEFPVPATYLGGLRADLPVTATAAAFVGREFSGRVSAIDSRVDPVTRSVMVRALLPNGDGLLRPGMLMRVALSLNAREALMLPEEALIPQGDKHFVLVVDEAASNAVVRREVSIGARQPGRVEITQGVKLGEKAIVHGTTRVKPGDQVAIAAVDDGSIPLNELLKQMP